MTDKAIETEKNRQKNTDLTADLSDQRSAVEGELSKIYADPDETIANTGIQTFHASPKSSESGKQRSAVNQLFLTVSYAAKLAGIRRRLALPRGFVSRVLGWGAQAALAATSRFLS